MWFAALAALLAVAVVVLTPGGPQRLWRSLQSVWMLAAGVALQLVVGFVDFPADRIDDLGFGLLMVSYALLLAFCFVNVRLPGIWLIALGITLNTVVVGLNQGMPTTPTERTVDGQTVEEPIERTVKQRPESDDDLLGFLGDVIEIPDPIDNRISVGDILLAIGLIYSCVRLTRRPQLETDVQEEEAEEPVTSEFAAFWGIEPEVADLAGEDVSFGALGEDAAVPVMAESDTAIEAMAAVEGRPSDYAEPGYTKLAWDEDEIERKLAAGENRGPQAPLPPSPSPAPPPPPSTLPPPSTSGPRVLRISEEDRDPTPPPIHWTSEDVREPVPEPEPEYEAAPASPAPPPAADDDIDDADDPLGAELDKLFTRLSRGPDTQ